MPLFDEGKLLGLSRDTAPVMTGNDAAPPITQVGANINNDKVRRVWRVNLFNADPMAPHILSIYAGDAANTQRRLIMTVPIATGAAMALPLNGAHVKEPFFIVAPITSTIAVAVEENGIYVADEVGGQIQYEQSQYDLRG